MGILIYWLGFMSNIRQHCFTTPSYFVHCVSNWKGCTQRGVNWRIPLSQNIWEVPFPVTQLLNIGSFSNQLPVFRFRTTRDLEYLDVYSMLDIHFFRRRSFSAELQWSMFSQFPIKNIVRDEFDAASWHNCKNPTFGMLLYNVDFTTVGVESSMSARVRGQSGHDAIFTHKVAALIAIKNCLS